MTITLGLRSCNGGTFEIECPLLATITPELSEPPKRWDCGPATFDFLLDFLLELQVPDHDQRMKYVVMVAKGEWSMIYRFVVIHRGEQVPEGRLWPV